MLSPERDIEIVRYGMGEKGYRDAATYDERRYAGRANQYKQIVMANAYKKLLGSLKGKRILDVGCGTGRGVIDFAREATLAIGTDASDHMLRIAQRKARKSGAICIFATAYGQQLPFRDGTFDVVTVLNFLHLFTLETQREVVTEMKRVVKPGGMLILEFDNALHGLGLGLYKRWSGIERGALPSEIRYVIGDGSRVVGIYGAVLPVVWRLLYHLPRLGTLLEKVTYLPGLSRFSHRLYYKIVASTG